MRQAHRRARGDVPVTVGLCVLMMCVGTACGAGDPEPEIGAARPGSAAPSAAGAGHAPPDRSLLPGERGRLFHWSSGESTPRVPEGQRVHDRLAELYDSDALRDLPLPERGLAAVQRSLGAPSLASVAYEAAGLPPGVKAIIDTSSGERFVVDVREPEGMPVEELSRWLASASLEIAVDTRLDHAGDAALHFVGALFSDDERTMLATPEPCECGADGIIAWLPTPPPELLDAPDGREPPVVARRTLTSSGDWHIETGSRRSGVGYTVSRYQQSEHDADAVYAVRGDRGGHQLHLRTRSDCNGDGLTLRVDRGPATPLAAQCGRVDEDTIAYTIAGPDVDGAIESRIRAGNHLAVGVSGSRGDAEREWYHFSLRGSSAALEALAGDAAALGETATARLAAQALPSDVVDRIAASLRTAPVPAPAPAAPQAALPVGDFVARYADGLARQIERGWHPACAQIARSMRMIGNGSSPAHVRELQVDRMFDKVPELCLQ